MSIEATSPPSIAARVVRERRIATWLPTPLLLWSAAVPLLVAVAAVVFRPIAFVALAVDAAVLAAAMISWRTLPRDALEIERRVPAVLSVGRPNAIEVRVKNRSNVALDVQLNDDLFEYASAEGLPARFTLAPFGEHTLRYTVRPTRRGAFVLGDHIVRFTRRGALLWRQERRAASDDVSVYPDVLAVRQFDAWARQGLERVPGSARTRGGESEFERLRPYGRDDEVRHIDWRATARRRELTVRQFQTETQQSVVVMLDTGRTMRAEAEGLSFVDHALNATLMLGHVALSRGDQLGFLAFDDEPRAFVPPAHGLAVERTVIRAAFDLHARLAEPDFERVFAFVRTRVRKRSLVVIFTQVVDATAAAQLARLVRGLMPRHLPLCILLRDRDVDHLAMNRPAAPHDVYVNAAAAEAIQWRDQMARDLRIAGVIVIDAYPEAVTPSLLRKYAEIKSRQLL